MIARITCIFQRAVVAEKWPYIFQWVDLYIYTLDQNNRWWLFPTVFTKVLLCTFRY